MKIFNNDPAHRPDLFTNNDIERKLLINLLKSVDALNFAMSTLTSQEFFEPIYITMFNFIDRFYRNYYTILPLNALEIQLAREKIDDDMKRKLVLLHMELNACIPNEHTRYYLTELKDFRIKRELRDVFYDIKKGLEDDKPVPALMERVTQNILKISRETESEITRIGINGQADERKQLYLDKETSPEKFKGLPFGFTEIDEATGGIMPGNIGLIFARTGVGKSRLLFNIGCNIALTGKTVMYFTIEMEARMLQHMWESRMMSKNWLSGGPYIPFRKIVDAKLTDAERAVYFKFLDDSANSQLPFEIVDMPRGCTPGLIESELTMYKKQYNKLPDIILADYANLMHPNEKYDKGWEKFDILFRELKQVGRAHHLPIVTAMQQNRESLKSKDIGVEHIGLSDMAAAHCDFILHLKRDERDTVNKEMHINFVKARYSEQVSTTVLADFAINYMQDAHLNTTSAPVPTLPVTTNTFLPMPSGSMLVGMGDAPMSSGDEDDDF